MRTCVIVAQDGCGAIIRITCEKPRSGASVVHACARKQQAGHGRRRQHGRQRPHHHCPPPLTTSHSSCACAWRAISVFFNTQVHAHAGAHTQPAGASPENLVRGHSSLKTVIWRQWTGGPRAGAEGCQGVCLPSSRSCLSSACAWYEALRPATRALFFATTRALQGHPGSRPRGHATEERGAAVAALSCAQCHLARARPARCCSSRAGAAVWLHVRYRSRAVTPAKPGRRRAADEAA